MTRARAFAGIPFVLAAASIAGCGGVFESKLAAPQAYVLRLPPPATVSGDASLGSVLVQRPDTGPGLNTDRIALVRSEGRFDFYAAARWAAPTPDLIESVLVDALRATNSYSAVLDDASPFAPRYDLRVTLRRFEADYSAGGAGAASEPTVHVVLDCAVGRRRDRTLIASFTAQGSARAQADRLGAVIAAFEASTASAVTQLLAATNAAIAADPAVAGTAPHAASEGR